MLINSKYVNYNKNSVILPYMIGKSYELYNGNKFILIKVNQNMLGFRLYEFILTRKVGKIHKLKKTKSKKGIKK